MAEVENLVLKCICLIALFLLLLEKQSYYGTPHLKI